MKQTWCLILKKNCWCFISLLRYIKTTEMLWEYAFLKYHTLFDNHNHHTDRKNKALFIVTLKNTLYMWFFFFKKSIYNVNYENNKGSYVALLLPNKEGSHYQTQSYQIKPTQPILLSQHLPFVAHSAPIQVHLQQTSTKPSY